MSRAQVTSSRSQAAELYVSAGSIESTSAVLMLIRKTPPGFDSAAAVARISLKAAAEVTVAAATPASANRRMPATPAAYIVRCNSHGHGHGDARLFFSMDGEAA